MATQLQFRRGTSAQNNSYTGLVGEISLDTDTNNIRIHDGSTGGGAELIPQVRLLHMVQLVLLLDGFFVMTLLFLAQPMPVYLL